MSEPPFNPISPPELDLVTGQPEFSLPQQVGGDVVLPVGAVIDPAFAYEEIPTYHPDGVAERRRLADAKRREVSHYVARRTRRWERVGFDRVYDDQKITTTVETGSDVELTVENKRQVSEKLRLELGYGDIVKIEGEISQTLEFNNTGVFKTSNNRTETVELQRSAGYIYVHWQMVERIEILRVRRGEHEPEPMRAILGRGQLVTIPQPMKPPRKRKGPAHV